MISNERVLANVHFMPINSCLKDILRLPGSSPERVLLEHRLADYLDSYKTSVAEEDIYIPAFDTSGLRKGEYRVGILIAQMETAQDVLEMHYRRAIAVGGQNATANERNDC